MLTPLEEYLRPGDSPNDWLLVIRGRPLSVSGLLLAAGRTLAEFSWRDQPVAAVSAEVTSAAVSIDMVLAGPRLRTRRTYAAADVTDLIDGGFPVLGTFGAPHVSVVLPEYDEVCVRALLEILGPGTNPHSERSSR